MYIYIYICMYVSEYIYMYSHVLYATYSSARPYLHRRLPGPDLHFDIRQLKLFGHSSVSGFKAGTALTCQGRHWMSKIAEKTRQNHMIPYDQNNITKQKI